MEKCCCPIMLISKQYLWTQVSYLGKMLKFPKRAHTGVGGRKIIFREINPCYSNCSKLFLIETLYDDKRLSDRVIFLPNSGASCFCVSGIRFQRNFVSGIRPSAKYPASSSMYNSVPKYNLIENTGKMLAPGNLF